MTTHHMTAMLSAVALAGFLALAATPATAQEIVSEETYVEETLVEFDDGSTALMEVLVRKTLWDDGTITVEEEIVGAVAEEPADEIIVEESYEEVIVEETYEPEEVYEEEIVVEEVVVEESYEPEEVIEETYEETVVEEVYEESY